MTALSALIRRDVRIALRVGGGALMTPILVLLFGIAPHTAIGTDLVFASITKMAGVGVHALGYVAAISEQDQERIDVANYAGTTLIGKLGIERAA